jgi:ubiquinone/menaquinone biosynthesis C-methylase UbiE
MVAGILRSVDMKSKLFPESALAHQLLDGLRGIEIGESAHNAFGLDTINVDKFGEDDPRGQVYRDSQVELCGRAAEVDVVASGERLPFADQSYDFVLASHVIEHFYNPIAALKEWCRVARKYVFLVVPKRDALESDRDKPLTSLAEIQARQEQPSFESDEHHSRWTAESFSAMCEAFGFRVVGTRDPDDKVGNGFIVVIQTSNDAQDLEKVSALFGEQSAIRAVVSDHAELPAQSWTETVGEGVTRINCKPFDLCVPTQLAADVPGQRFGVAYAVHLLGGQRFRFGIRLFIPSKMTCLIEVCGYSTKYQRGLATIDSEGACIDLGEEMSAPHVRHDKEGYLDVELEFRSPQSATDWVYLLFNGASDRLPEVLGFHVYPLDTDPDYRSYESAREYPHSTWFAVQAAQVFRNYFHFEFELHRPGANLIGLELLAPVGVTGVRWISGLDLKHDGRGLVPERTTASQMRSPALMERFGPAYSYAGHQLYGLLSDFTDWLYMPLADSDQRVDFHLLARFDDGKSVELPLLPVDPSSFGVISRLKPYLNRSSGGKFIEVGGLGSRSEIVRAWLPVGWKYTAVDIHAGINVDIVGDAHHLSDLLPHESADIVFSADVMEHMLVPWKFVLEANRVLKEGGLFVAVLPSAWPLHAETWDYWRMSEHAWPALLNLGTGFEIIETGVQGRCAVIPFLLHDKASIRTQSGNAHVHTFAIARKVSEPTADWSAYDIGLTRGKYLRNA